MSESNTRVYGSDGIRNLEILNGVGIQGFKFGGFKALSLGGYWFSDLEFRVERFRVRRLAGFGVRAWGFSFEGLGFKGRGLGGSRLWDPRVVALNFD